MAMFTKENVKQNQTITSVLGGLSVILLALHTYGHVPSFLYLTERVAFPPRYFSFLLIVTSLLFLLFKWREGCEIRVWRPVFIWYVLACLLVFVYYMLGKFGYIYLVDEYATGFFQGLIIILCVVILLNIEEGRLFFLLCQMIKIFFLLSCLAIIYDFYFPGDFVSQESRYSNFGRGAGQYVNANSAGKAIICGWTFIFLLYKSNTKYFYFLTAIGIYALLLSFSRSAWVVGFFSLCMALCFRVIKPRMFINIILLAILSLVLFKATLHFYSFIIEHTSLVSDYSPLHQRLEAYTYRTSFNEKALLDHSGFERIECAKASIETIKLSPIFGNGIGSVQYLHNMFPHNSYLDYWADFGILGLILNLSLLIIIFFRFYKKRDAIGEFYFLSGCIIFAYGFFSHALISNHPLLLIIAVSLSNFSFDSVRRR
jgi:O-antigen ligase